MNPIKTDMKTPPIDLKFIIIHKGSGFEIEMPILSICDEYSLLTFSTKRGAYNDDYNGIGRIPDVKNDTAENYYVYVEINGIRYLYDGLFYNGDYSETKRNHEPKQESRKVNSQTPG